ncbi:MAG: hypothetical protein H6873_07140 [Hyphomicrobiaceae bacterium]|nr:hypothetical protein [Hyphomicrobiaceae bacterium]
MTDSRVLRFVALLAKGGRATLEADGTARLSGQKTSATVEAHDVALLVSQGILTHRGDLIEARPEAQSWLRRQRLAESAAKSKKAPLVATVPGLNLAESPLSRLASIKEDGAPFLAPHLVLAGERFARLYERAHLRQRVTMSYDPTGKIDGSPARSADGVTDIGLDARNRLDALLQALPEDAARAVAGVCGQQKGLQLIEQERHWPRRSGKMLLRIGLELLAREMGLRDAASGRTRTLTRAWIGEGARPAEFG